MRSNQEAGKCTKFSSWYRDLKQRARMFLHGILPNSKHSSSYVVVIVTLLKNFNYVTVLLQGETWWVIKYNKTMKFRETAAKPNSFSNL